MMVLKRAVGLMMLAVLTAAPATAAACLALCAIPAGPVQGQQAPAADHGHGAAHDHGSPLPSAPVDAQVDSARRALQGVPQDCGAHGSAALPGVMALVSGRTNAGLATAGQDQPVAGTSPGPVDHILTAGDRRPSAMSTPVPIPATSLLVPLRI
jgi:hypothetical protein